MLLIGMILLIAIVGGVIARRRRSAGPQPFRVGEWVKWTLWLWIPRVLVFAFAALVLLEAKGGAQVVGYAIVVLVPAPDYLLFLPFLGLVTRSSGVGSASDGLMLVVLFMLAGSAVVSGLALAASGRRR